MRCCGEAVVLQGGEEAENGALLSFRGLGMERGGWITEKTIENDCEGYNVGLTVVSLHLRQQMIYVVNSVLPNRRSEHNVEG